MRKVVRGVRVTERDRGGVLGEKLVREGRIGLNVGSVELCYCKVLRTGNYGGSC